MGIGFAAADVPPFSNPCLATVVDFIYYEDSADHLRNVAVIFRWQ